jgi:UDP-N-acetylglucosamine 4-epimerase
VINGDGTTSRDFTYIDNVIQMNHLAATTTNPEAINQVFNTAVGERNDLNQLAGLLKKFLSESDPEIAHTEVLHGLDRIGDIPHSHASIAKAKKILSYNPLYNLGQGIKIATKWYYANYVHDKQIIP